MRLKNLLIFHQILKIPEKHYNVPPEVYKTYMNAWHCCIPNRKIKPGRVVNVFSDSVSDGCDPGNVHCGPVAWALKWWQITRASSLWPCMERKWLSLPLHSTLGLQLRSRRMDLRSPSLCCWRYSWYKDKLPTHKPNRQIKM